MIIEPANTPSGDVYKVMIRSVIPRPIAWVSTRCEEGVLNLAPFSFFTAVSSDPPTLAFSVAKRSGGVASKDTLVNIERTREFVVNIVTEDVAEVMNATAIDYPPDTDEFAIAGLTPAPSIHVDVPRVAESPVNYECELYDVVNIGSAGEKGASLVIGKIIAIHIDERILADGKIDAGLLKPVARLGGLEYARLGERFTMSRQKR